MSLKPTSDHAQGVGLIALTSIIIGDRVRLDSSDIRAKIESNLAPSIAEFGLIHPILLDKSDIILDGENYKGETIQSMYTLIAGWSRLQSFALLRIKEIPYNLRDNLPEAERQALEIEENIRRHDMTWQEECLGIKKIHLKYRASAHARGKRWGQTQTGHLLGVGAGHISDVLLVADLLEKGDAEISSCTVFSHTRAVLMTRKQDSIKAELAKRGASITTTVKKLTRSSGPVASAEPSTKDTHTKPSPSRHEPLRSTPATEQVHEVSLSKMLFNEDNKEWFKRQPSESVDLIYTDIPYGIDMDNLDMADIERVVDAHDVEENIEQMPTFLHNAYRVLRPDSFCLFWMDIKHWEKLVQYGLDAGFMVQPYPLVWVKTHECKNRAAHAWWTKAIEYVMVMRKGKATLSKPQLTNYFACSGKAERRMQQNPFAKPFEFSKWMLEPVLRPGATVLDCYAGEGSIVRALLNLGANVIAVEKDEKHFNGLLEHVKKFYAQTLKGTVHFI